MKISKNCNYFRNNLCRSCSLLAADINDGNIKKVAKSTELLKGFIDENTVIRDLFLLSEPFNSRARARISVSGTTNKPILGLLDKDFNGIELLSCPIHFKIINQTLKFIPDLITEFKLTPYDIKSRSGELKSIIVQTNSDSKEIILRFIVRSKNTISNLKKLSKRLISIIPELKVVTANIQPIPHQIPEGSEEHILTEAYTIEEKYSNIFFFIAPKSFTQVTPKVAEALYTYVRNIITKIKPSVVVDLYCGIGGFGLFASEHSKKVISIEISKEAISCAKKAAKKNKFENITFYSDQVSNKLDIIKKENPDLIICNPPRRGLANDISLIRKLDAKTIIYSSCNPETLAKDISILKDKYQLTSIAPFDMFPLTKHLELVVTLEKIKC